MTRSLHLVRDPDELPPDPATLNPPPDFTAETRRQVTGAIELLDEDTTECPRVPWTDLDAALGPLRPWNWWTIAAHFKQGKTTVLMSLVAQWIDEGRPVYMLPLEQPPDVMRATLAALRTGLDTAKVLGGKWNELPPDAVKRISGDMSWQQGPVGSELLYFNPWRDVDRRKLRAISTEAVMFGAETIIVDHLHQLDPGPGNEFAGFRGLCHEINDQAREYRIPWVTTAQMHRHDRDRVARHRPPNPMSVQGGDTLGQLTHVLVGAYRPFRGNGTLSKSEEVAVRKGEGDVREYLEPNCVGFHVMAHRIDGQQAGRIVKLRYEHGRIRNPTSTQRMMWEEPRG
jgi:hypothetical protein